VLEALAGHPSITTLDLLRLSGRISAGEAGPWAPEWRALVQLALSSPRLQKVGLTLRLTLSGEQRATVCGRGMALVAAAPCAAVLRDLCLSDHKAYSSDWFHGPPDMAIGLADAACLVGPGCGLRLKEVEAMLDVWQDVADLDDALGRLRRHSGRKRQRQQAEQPARQQLERCAWAAASCCC
jgi:hypothetical protein